MPDANKEHTINQVCMFALLLLLLYLLNAHSSPIHPASLSPSWLVLRLELLVSAVWHSQRPSLWASLRNGSQRLWKDLNS